MRETIMTLILIGVLYACVAKGLELWQNLKSDLREVKNALEDRDERD